MVRLLVPAIVFAAGIDKIQSVSLDGSCAEDASLSRIELDESSMLQQRISNVQIVQVSAEGTSQQIVSSSDVLASAWGLVHAVKEKSDDISNITLAAKDYASIIESEVIPSIEAATLEIDNLLATQREFVKQCDARLHAGETKLPGLHHTFLEQRSLHEACSTVESRLAEQVANCLAGTAVREECADVEVSHKARAAECTDLRAAVDEAACERASHAHGVCAAYSDCRSNSMAVYQSAASSAAKRAHGHRAQLAEAKQAQCIAHGLMTSAGDVQSMTKQLEGCDAFIPKSKDEKQFELHDAKTMPPAIVCQDAAFHSCSDDFVELDLGFPVTWSASCTSCPAMTKAIAISAAPSSWLSRVTSFASSAKKLAESTLDPRQRSAMTVSLIGVGAKTTLVTTGQAASTGQYLVILIAVPLVALGIALGVAVAVSPGNQFNRTSDRNSSETMTGGRRGFGSNIMGQRGLKEMPSPKLADPRLSTRKSFGSSYDRPSIGGGPLHGHPYSHDRSPAPSVGGPRQSLPPSIGAPVVDSNYSGVPGGLCPELIVPEGSECILGVPSLSGAPPGEVLLKNITDKTGESLLYVGLTAAPAGGEYVLLAKKDQQELAFCELGSAVRSEGWAGKIFRWDGELYARLREEQPSEVGRRSGVPSANRTFVVISAVGAPWELRVTGNFKERKLCIEDGTRQVVAMVSPGDELAFSQPAGEFYKLRLGPRADSCTVIVALLAIERLLCP